MTTPHRLVSTRPTGSTSSRSEDYFSDDDDSIGPLPILKRNVSFTRRNYENEEKVRASVNARGVTLFPPIQPRSMPTSPAKVERDPRCPIPSLPRPRRVQSLHLPEKTMHPCENMFGRRASMQPEAAIRSQPRRPDPPEQIRSILSLAAPHQTKVLECNVAKPLDQHNTQIEAPKRTIRALSMPLSARDNQSSIGHPKMLAKSTKVQPVVRNEDVFLPRRSKSIARSFVRPNGIDHDVWVERMVVREGKSPQVFFKAVFSKECKVQPPTGALNVIYMDELVRVQNQEGGESQEEAVVAPVVKKLSFWGKPKKDKPTSKATSRSPSTTLGKLKSALFLRTSTGKSH